MSRSPDADRRPAEAEAPAAGDAAFFVPEDEDPPLDWRRIGPEDWTALVLFWVLAVVVFLQFFTRYVLNDSLAWTEEIARYLLIGVGFVGSVAAVRRNTHIFVEFFYRYLSRRAGRALSTLVDLVRILFFAAATVIAVELARRTRQSMVSIDLSKGWVYWTVCAGFAAMTLRSLQVAWRHWRHGGSALTEPGGTTLMLD